MLLFIFFTYLELMSSCMRELVYLLPNKIMYMHKHDEFKHSDGSSLFLRRSRYSRYVAKTRCPLVVPFA